ncbi:uncharacterized protein LOC115408863 [Salarias fasciatus]|uniref:Uncharacterized protein n=1 Tax=Salarias fasciatus TaxID=181472 RepID=A0A672JI59_SALFA|nr:ligand-dependent nuclear receptor-interacting factor 1 [Salarias fasciatus]
METSHSGTGVFYQAMPAIGADGARIMKLIPVQMVNGQFVQTQTSKPKATRTSMKTTKEPLHVAPKPPVGPSAMQQSGSGGLSSVNVLPKPVDSSLISLLTKQQQPQAVRVLPKISPKPAFATNCGQSVQIPSQLPVIVKSPALPKGQYLQIPPSAQIWTVPASELSQGIQKQILSSQESSSPSPGALNVVFVSPVTTVNPGVNPPGESSADSVQQLSKTWRQTSVGAKPHLKLIPKVSHRPNSPTRWVVEEVGPSAAVNVKPSPFSVASNNPQTDQQGGAVCEGACHQFSMNNSAEAPALTRRWVINKQDIDSGTSKNLMALTGRERVLSHYEAMKDVLPPYRQGQENTLLMCNGKVFLVAKKNNLFQDTSPTNGSELHQTVAVASSPASVDGAAPKSRVVHRNVREVDEVIDLCDEEDPPRRAASLAQPDEDNVIFVSYSPPKSQSGSVSLNIPLVQRQVKGRPGSRGSNRGPDRTVSGPSSGSAGRHYPRSSKQSDVIVVDGDQSDRRQTSLGDQSTIGQMESPGHQSTIGQTESLGRQSTIGQTESPGRQNIGQTESPGRQNIGQTESPGRQNIGQTESSGRQNIGQTESSGRQNIGQTESSGRQNIGQTESSGRQNIEQMESPGDQNIRLTESPGHQSTIGQTESPGRQHIGQTESPGRQNIGQTESPGRQNIGQTESSGRQNIGQTESSGRQNIGQTESSGRQNIGQTESSGRQNIEQMESPGDQNIRLTESPGHQSTIGQTESLGHQSTIGQTESLGHQSTIGQTESLGHQSTIGQTESPGHQNIGQTESPGHQNVGQTESPGRQNVGQTESPGRQNVGQTESPGRQNVGQTESPGRQNVGQTESPGRQNVGQTESPGRQNVGQTESPGRQSSRQTEIPGHQSSRQTESPGHQSSRQTESPGHQSSRQTGYCKNISSTCALSPLTDRQLRQVHGITADVQVVLQRIDEDLKRPQEAAEEVLHPVSPSQTSLCLAPQTVQHRRPPCDRRSAAASTEPRGEGRSGDRNFLPNTRRMGRRRKRTTCKCCSPEENSSTAEPPGKKGAGAKTGSGDEQPCRRHSGPATRSSKVPKQSVRIRTAKGVARDKLLRSGVS